MRNDDFGKDVADESEADYIPGYDDGEAEKEVISNI